MFTNTASNGLHQQLRYLIFRDMKTDTVKSTNNSKRHYKRYVIINEKKSSPSKLENSRFRLHLCSLVDGSEHRTLLCHYYVVTMFEYNFIVRKKSRPYCHRLNIMLHLIAVQ